MPELIRPIRDLDMLKEIVSNLENFIDEYYFNVPPPGSFRKYEVSPMIPGRFHEEFKYSWDEVKHNMERMLKLIEKGPIPKLRENGLIGKQLILKHKICIDALNNARDWHTNEKMEGKSRDKIWYKKWFSYCKKVLKGSNIVIGSLKSCIPGAEVLSECVEGIIYLSELGTENSE